MAAEGGDRARIVLVVDDEARILAAIRRTLRSEGYEILTAETTTEAFALLAEHPVDLVLSDHKMPGMTGIEFLSRVAELHPRATRMLITGWTEAVPSGELDRHRVSALISKPWDNMELKRTLREALSAG